MPFRRAVQRYGKTPEPETPYQRAGQLWDDRIGAARVQARNWRWMAFGGLFLTASLSAALVWQSLQSRVVPYVVEVDRLGEARSVVPAETDYSPTDPQIAWHLGRFIGNVRSRSLDPVLSEYERGTLTETSQWTAMVTVRIQTPRSADALRKNPLGLYVEAIDWSRELDAKGLSQARSSASRSMVTAEHDDLAEDHIQRDADPGLTALPNERNAR